MPMLMEQVREVKTVSQEIEDESSYFLLTLGQGYGQNLRMRITVKPEFRVNAMTSVLMKPDLSCAYHHRFYSKHKKGPL